MRPGSVQMALAPARQAFVAGLPTPEYAALSPDTPALAHRAAWQFVCQSDRRIRLACSVSSCSSRFSRCDPLQEGIRGFAASVVVAERALWIAPAFVEVDPRHIGLAGVAKLLSQFFDVR